MAKLSTGGFVVLPGGFGTFEELMEMVTWNQVGDRTAGQRAARGFGDVNIVFVSKIKSDTNFRLACMLSP
jgi:hypothetical protein